MKALFEFIKISFRLKFNLKDVRRKNSEILESTDNPN